MCGIVGFFSKEESYDSNSICRMMEAQIHRGPNDKGLCAIDSIQSKFIEMDAVTNSSQFNSWLGFNRLSIRDISMNGHQPMFNTDRSIVIIFNGEIYNNRELNMEYLNEVPFKSNTDTETILLLYEKLGIDDTVKLLNGMFTFCIVDLQTNKAYLARDRVGIKPLYVYKSESIVVFSSELKSIIASRLIDCAVSKVALYENIVFGSSYKHTLIYGVDYVESGTYCQIDMKTLEITSHCFWNPIEEMKKNYRMSFDDAKEKLNNIIKNAVKRQMVSDVPLGCQLSGGVDSSLVTYELRHNAEILENSNIKLWGIGITPSDSNFSEIEYMQKAARIAEVKLETYSLDNDWVVDNWRKATWHSDGIPEFVNDIGILKLAEKAKDSVTVLLSGEGSDELFAGYWWISSVGKLYLLFQLYKKLHLHIKKVDRMFNKIFKINNNCSSDDYIRDYMLYGQDAISDDSMNEICSDIGLYRDLISRDRRQVIDAICNSHKSILDRMRLRDLILRLPVLLNRQDKMTMAYSIENRVPLLDNEVIDFALTMPKRYLSKIICRNYPVKQIIHGHNPISIHGKFILKEMVSDIFGKDFAYRDKMGFSLPVGELIKILYARDEYTEIRGKLTNRNIINMKTFDSIIDRILNNKTRPDDVKLAWRILSLELFFEEVLDKYQKKG